MGLAQVDQAQVVLGAAGGQLEAGCGQVLGQLASVLHHLRRVGLELGLQGFGKGHGLGGHDVHQGAALGAGEHGLVDQLGDFLVVGQDQAAARAAQGFVGGGADDVAQGERAGVRAAGDQAGDVGHVAEQERAALVGDGAEAREVDHARISREAADQQLGLGFHADLFDRVVVEEAAVGAGFVVHQRVVHGLEPLAGDGHLGAVGQMAAFGEFDGDEGVARVEQGVEHGGVGVGARVRLHIGELAVEQLLGALDGQVLDQVVLLAAGVVAAAGVAFGVLVGHARAGGGHHGGRSMVLAGDHFQRGVLTLFFGGDQVGDLGVVGGQDGQDGGGIGVGHGVMKGVQINGEGRQF